MKFTVPEGMWDAAQVAAANLPMHGNCGSVEKVNAALKAALRWLSENPIVPTLAQMRQVETVSAHEPQGSTKWLSDVLTEWQRRMFLAPHGDRYDSLLDSALLNVPPEVERVDLYSSGGLLLASRKFVKVSGAAPAPVDTREMTVYDCLACKKSWRQQLREPIESCVYCGSANTKPIATVSPVREYSLEVR